MSPRPRHPFARAFDPRPWFDTAVSVANYITTGEVAQRIVKRTQRYIADKAFNAARDYVTRSSPTSYSRVAFSAPMPRRSSYRRRGRRPMRRRRARRRAVRRPATVTAQRDTATLSRNSGRGRSGDRAFARRMRRALLSEQPLNVYTALLKASDTFASGNQTFQGPYLADCNTTNQGDLWNVFKDAYLATTLTDVEQERIYIKSSAMDVQFKNNGTEYLLVDMYILICRQSYATSATIQSDIGNWFGDMTSVGVTGPGTPGITLYQIPAFTRRWRIQRSQRFLVKPDEVIATTVYGPKNRSIAGRSLQDYGAMRGITRAVVFQVRGVPENTASDSGLTGYTFAWSAQSRFTYARPPGNTVETVGQTK